MPADDVQPDRDVELPRHGREPGTPLECAWRPQPPRKWPAVVAAIVGCRAGGVVAAAIVSGTRPGGGTYAQLPSSPASAMASATGLA
jgi:hypothetical protein